MAGLKHKLVAALRWTSALVDHWPCTSTGPYRRCHTGSFWMPSRRALLPLAGANSTAGKTMGAVDPGREGSGASQGGRRFRKANREGAAIGIERNLHSWRAHFCTESEGHQLGGFSIIRNPSGRNPEVGCDRRGDRHRSSLGRTLAPDRHSGLPQGTTGHSRPRPDRSGRCRHFSAALGQRDHQGSHDLFSSRQLVRPSGHGSSGPSRTGTANNAAFRQVCRGQ